MFESLESRCLMSASLVTVPPLHIDTTVGIHVSAAVNVNAVLKASVNAKVYAKLGLNTSIKVNANANIKAIIGVCSTLHVNTYGVLMTSAGAAVDTKALLGLLGKYGCNTKIDISAKAAVDLCAKLGIKARASLSLTGKFNACENAFAQLGLNIAAKLHISL